MILNFENEKMDKWLRENSENIIKKINNKHIGKKNVKRSINEVKIYGKCGEVENLDYNQ